MSGRRIAATERRRPRTRTSQHRPNREHDALEATSATRIALPHRDRLEGRFGRPLDTIDVYAGPDVASALDDLGAVSATRDGQIFLADAAAPLPVVAHEVTHALQSREHGTGTRTDAVEPAGSPAEGEASQVATDVARPRLPGARVSVLEGLGRETLALLRMPSQRGGDPPTLRIPPATPAPSAAPHTSASPETAAPESTTGGTAGRNAVPSSNEAAPEPTASEGLQLPPAPELTVDAEQVAAQQAAIAEAENALAGAASPADLLQAYAAAPPTVKAQSAGTLGDDVASISATESQEWQSDVPELHATLNGTEPPTSAVPVVAPPVHSVEVLEDVAPAPEPDLPDLEVSGAFEPAQDVTRSFSLLSEPSPEVLAAQIGDSLDSVQTNDPSVPRTAGPPPGIPLGGETDPARIAEAEDAARAQATEARTEATEAVVAGRGPEQVQPTTLDEPQAVGELPVPDISVAAAPEGPAAYVAMALPPEVQVSFDEQQHTAMEQSMAATVEQSEQATTDRDSAKESAVSEAEAGAARLNAEANGKQTAAVVDARTGIQTARQDTIDAQEREVQRVETEAGDQRRADESAIETKVGEEQRGIDAAYAGAERDIHDEVADGERRAQEEREAAEREAEDQSWWDRAVNFVKDALNALVDAIGAVFDAVRSAVNGILDAVKAVALAAIDAAASFIKSAIAAFGELLKAAITGLLGEIFPELAAALNSAIDRAVQTAQNAVDAVADALKAGVTALVEGLRAGLNTIINAYQAAITLALSVAQAAITGDWGALAMRVLEAVLRVVGVSPEEFYAFAGRAEETFQIIVDDPGGFLGNILSAVSGGIQLFADHIVTHLQNGVIGWLTGALGGAGIVLPERFDLLGVLDVARQVLGLTWDMLRARARTLIGEQNVERLEVVLGFIQTLVTEGWSGLWAKILDSLATVRDTVFNAISSYIQESVVMAAITKLATMFNPVGAIVQLVLTAWNIYTFLRDQLARIMEVVQTVTTAIGDIARGVLDNAKTAVEAVLGRLLPLAIDLLARVLGLGDVAERVREIIEEIRAMVNRAIDALLQRIAAAFRGGGTTAAAGPAGPAAAGEQDAAAGPVVLAQEALRQRLTGHEDTDEVRAILTGIRREQSATGLSGLELRGPDDAGRYEAWAAASPWQLLGFFDQEDDKKGESTQKPTYLRVTLHVMDASAAYAGSRGSTPVQPPRRIPTTEATRAATEALGSTLDPIGGKPPRGNSRLMRSGGVVEAPQPGSSRLELLAFNTGRHSDIAKPKPETSNETHAEYQFHAYLTRNPSIAASVTQIDATMTYSPCPRCSQTLSQFPALTPQADGRRFLHWKDPYRRPGNATTTESLRATAGWAITKDSIPPTAPDEGKHELSAAHWAPIIEAAHATHPLPGQPVGAKPKRTRR